MHLAFYTACRPIDHRNRILISYIESPADAASEAAPLRGEWPLTLVEPIFNSRVDAVVSNTKFASEISSGRDVELTHIVNK